MILTAFFILLAVLGVVHHHGCTGLLFQWDQFIQDLHHEDLIVMSLIVAIGIMIGRRGR